MTSPPINKNMDSLYSEFRRRIEKWLAAARLANPSLKITIGETRRTLQRQQWLYAQGRSRKGQVVTYTLDSKHRLGCAVDLVITKKLTPWIAIWDFRTWNTLYVKTPPENFGLERLEFEQVHLQLPDTEVQALLKAKKLVQT